LDRRKIIRNTNQGESAKDERIHYCTIRNFSCGFVIPLHKKIDSINDNAILEAIYTILNQKKVSESYSLSAEQLEELEERD
jgi:hypothetical protein